MEPSPGRTLRSDWLGAAMRPTRPADRQHRKRV